VILLNQCLSAMLRWKIQGRFC